MAAEARMWSHRADVRKLAHEITRTAPPGRCDAQIGDVWQWITTHVPHRHMREIALIDPAHLTIGTGADCKTLAALAAALLRSLGWRTGFRYGRRGDRWHVWTLAECPQTGRIVSIDPTYPQFGIDWRGNEQADELHTLWIDPPPAGNLAGVGKLPHPTARPPSEDEWRAKLWQDRDSVRNLRNVAWGGVVVTARPWEGDQLYLVRTPADAQDIWYDHPHYQATCALIASTPGAFAIVIPWPDPNDSEQWIFFKKGEGGLARKKWELVDRNVILKVYQTPLAWTPDRAPVWIESEKLASEDNVSRHDSAKKCFHGRGKIDSIFKMHSSPFVKIPDHLKGLSADDWWRPGWETAMRADLIPSKFKGKPIGEIPGLATRKSNICAGHWRGGKPGFDLGSAIADFFIGAASFVPVVGPALSMAGGTAKALVEADAQSGALAHAAAVAPGMTTTTTAGIENAIAQMVVLGINAAAPNPPPYVLGSVPMSQVVAAAAPVAPAPVAPAPGAGSQTSITPPVVPASGAPSSTTSTGPAAAAATAIAALAGILFAR